MIQKLCIVVGENKNNIASPNVKFEFDEEL